MRDISPPHAGFSRLRAVAEIISYSNYKFNCSFLYCCQTRWSHYRRSLQFSIKCNLYEVPCLADFYSKSCIWIFKDIEINLLLIKLIYLSYRLNWDRRDSWRDNSRDLSRCIVWPLNNIGTRLLYKNWILRFACPVYAITPLCIWSVALLGRCLTLSAVLRVCSVTMTTTLRPLELRSPSSARW